MPEIHVLNVGQGDCTIIQSGSGHITMFDICGGNLVDEEDRVLKALNEKAVVKGNFQMCNKPMNPISFLKNRLGSTSIFRFILSHPDMDHLDGFDNLIAQCSVTNFWDSGVRKEKPDFKGSPYKEDDWDRYVNVRDGKAGITVVSPRAGAKNKYFNMDENGKEGGDYISIYAPDEELVKEANNNGDANDASYVIVYRSSGGRILLPGDAHNKTWDFVLKNYEKNLIECEFMVAPHHGRDSDRDWTFLDKIKPKFTVLGCAPSANLAYDQWNRRGLDKITQNQAGNIAVYPDSDGLDIYIENEKFAEKSGCDTSITDKYGNFFYKRIIKAK